MTPSPRKNREKEKLEPPDSDCAFVSFFPFSLFFTGRRWPERPDEGLLGQVLTLRVSLQIGEIKKDKTISPAFCRLLLLYCQIIDFEQLGIKFHILLHVENHHRGVFALGIRNRPLAKVIIFRIKQQCDF